MRYEQASIFVPDGQLATILALHSDDYKMALIVFKVLVLKAPITTSKPPY